MTPQSSLSVRDVLKIKGEGFVMGFPKETVKTYDDYLALGIQPKHVTVELCEELLKERVIKDYAHNHNLIVNPGLLQVGNMLTGNISSYAQLPSPVGWFSYVGVGTSSTAPTSTDTDLNAYVGTPNRMLVSAAFMLGNNVAKWDTYIPPSQWQTTWYEIGHFTTLTIATGAMGSHLLINPGSGYVKGANSAIIDIQWTL